MFGRKKAPRVAEPPERMTPGEWREWAWIHRGELVDSDVPLHLQPGATITVIFDGDGSERTIRIV